MALKKSIALIGTILLLLSIYHDLQKDKMVRDEILSVTFNDETMFVVKKRVKPGDTMLSLVEEVNGGKLHQFDIDKIMNDFKNVNPNLKSNALTVNEYYYVPLYKSLSK